jgi:hypothetical protein
MTETEFAARTKTMIHEQSELLSGQVTRDHALISFVESKRHFWSPWLHLELRQSETQREIYGRYSPHPSIWTAFMFSYLSLFVLTFFAAIIGCAQCIAGEPPWAFWFIPVCLTLAILLWLASRTGQRLAHDQMEELTDRVRNWSST